MFYYFVVSCLCNFAIAAAIPEEKDAKILGYNYKNFGRGKYEFSYITSNGIKRIESGQLVNVGQDNEHIAVYGTYSYIDPNGETRAFQYTADENGYYVHFLESLDIRVGEENERAYLPPSGFAAPVSPQLASLLGK